MIAVVDGFGVQKQKEQETMIMIEEPQTHTFIGGCTGSGKTVFASKLFQQSNRLAIFINTNNEVLPEQKSDIVFHDIDGFCHAINHYKKATRLCLSPTMEKDITIGDINEIIQILFDMGKNINENKIEPTIWCELFIDEIQEYQAKHGKAPYITRVWKRGRRYGIIGIAISQRPADVSHTVLTQSETHYLFNMGIYEKGYFSAYGIPVFEDEYMEWLQNDYHYLKYEKGKVTMYEPVEI